ncbi:MAG: ACT domain-containing protein, partial [Victivallales bacterium]|nr:ACT domain-containing protein [Victivallales bacterium]
MAENKQLRMKAIGQDFSVCKVKDYSRIDLGQPFVFTGSTDEEKSLVCSTAIVPQNTVERDDGWKALRIIGMLDFSLVGILAQISNILAENSIGIFAVSTFNTDYIFVKKNNFDKSIKALED